MATNANITVHSGAVATPTLQGQGPARFPTGGKIRAGDRDRRQGIGPAQSRADDRARSPGGREGHLRPGPNSAGAPPRRSHRRWGRVVAVDPLAEDYLRNMRTVTRQ